MTTINDLISTQLKAADDIRDAYTRLKIVRASLGCEDRGDREMQLADMAIYRAKRAYEYARELGELLLGSGDE